MACADVGRFAKTGKICGSPRVALNGLLFNGMTIVSGRLGPSGYRASGALTLWVPPREPAPRQGGPRKRISGPRLPHRRTPDRIDAIGLPLRCGIREQPYRAPS